MLVPGVDLDLIVAEERIGLIVADRAVVSAGLFPEAQLRSTVRVLLGFLQTSDASCEEDALAARLAASAGAVERFGAALLFGRRAAGCPQQERIARAR